MMDGSRREFLGKISAVVGFLVGSSGESLAKEGEEPEVDTDTEETTPDKPRDPYKGQFGMGMMASFSMMEEDSTLNTPNLHSDVPEDLQERL